LKTWNCDNDIWVIGSAVVGNSCFACITGESMPDSDYEIDATVEKNDDEFICFAYKNLKS